MELSRDERDALKLRAATLIAQSVADLRTTWRLALKKEAEDRAAEIQELCKLHDLSALNTQLSELVAAEAALPPLHTIRPECYACALPIVGTDPLSRECVPYRLIERRICCARSSWSSLP